MLFRSDHIIYGTNLSAASTYYTLRNDDGYAWKTSYKFPFQDFYFEPYYEFMSVEESDVVSGSYEPSNTTTEYGLKVTKLFGEKKSDLVSNHKTIFNNEKYYFGIQALFSEVETGMYEPTGTAKIDESADTGFSIITGTRIADKINDFPINVDLEIGFNQFGEAVQTCNNGDSTKTDGRYRNGLYAAGTTLSCTQDNNAVVIAEQ